MADEGGGTFAENLEFAGDELGGIVGAVLAVAAGIEAETFEDGRGVAFELDEVGDTNDFFEGYGLADMAREAVEDEEGQGRGGGHWNGDELLQNFFSEVKGFIFQKSAAFEDIAEKLNFLCRKIRAGATCDDRAEIGAEIEMTAGATGETVALQPIAQRRFAGTRGAEEQQGCRFARI
jgi:hypothetical protein